VVFALSAPIVSKLSPLSDLPIWANNQGGENAVGTDQFTPLESVRVGGDFVYQLPMLIDALGGKEDEISFWIDAVINAVINVAVDVVKSIPSFSTSGAMQMGTDLDYLAQVCGIVSETPAILALKDLANLLMTDPADFESGKKAS